MSDSKPEKQKNHLLAFIEKLALFYFAPRLRTVFSSIYLISFSYAALYYVENIEYAVKFIVYTIVSSTVLLSINNLMWGTIFILTLIFPFSLSLYAIFLLYRIWEGKNDWAYQAKLAVTALFIVGGIFAIVVADDLIRFVASQDELRSFIEDNHLNGRI